MLFLVSSVPLYSSPDEIKEAIVTFASWLEDLKSKKKVLWFYPKIGKGSVVVFNVDSNDEMNDLMREWLKIVPVPVTYEIIPLVSHA
jgi:hypothetical protein